MQVTGFWLALLLAFQEPDPALQALKSVDVVQIHVEVIGLRGEVEVPDHIPDIQAYVETADIRSSRAWGRRFSGQTVENVALRMSMEAEQNVVTGFNISPAGKVPSYKRELTGTLLQATPRLLTDGTVSVNLNLESSRFPEPAPASDVIDQADLPSVASLTWKSTLLLKAGQPEVSVLQRFNGSRPDQSETTLIIVTATTKRHNE